MPRAFALVVVVAPAVIAVACSRLTPSPDDDADSGTDAPALVPQDAADGAIVDAPADAGLIVDEHFEGACTGWLFSGAARAVFAPGEGVGGSGACLVTVPNGDHVYRQLDVASNGFYEAHAKVRLSTSGKTAILDLAAYLDGSIDNSAQGTAVLGTAYVDVQAVLHVQRAPETFILELAAQESAEYFVDDVTLARQPR
jgi:hypothetical protein